MNFEDFLPETNLLIFYSAIRIIHFENQRWARARSRGMIGSSNGFGAFVDATFVISSIALLGFLVYWAIFVSWQQAIGLTLVAFAIGLIWSVLSTLVLRGESVFLWMISTFAIWPAIVVLYVTFVF